jgi:hypothetical protein
MNLLGRLVNMSSMVVDFNTMALHVRQYRTQGTRNVYMHVENAGDFSTPNAGAIKLEFQAKLEVSDSDDYGIKKNFVAMLRAAADIIELDQ